MDLNVLVILLVSTAKCRYKMQIKNISQSLSAKSGESQRELNALHASMQKKQKNRSHYITLLYKAKTPTSQTINLTSGSVHAPHHNI